MDSELAALGEVAGKEKRQVEGRPADAFFGHPRGLGFIVGLELWERFSFYGAADGRQRRVGSGDVARSGPAGPAG